MSASLKTVELEISLAIRKAIESKSLDPSSAMTIIHKGMELLSSYKTLKGADKKRILLCVLEQVSAGSDGILGTDDDILPESTLKAIKVIMEGNLVGDIVDTFMSIAKGAPVDVQKVVGIGMRLKPLVTGCFKCVSSKKPLVLSADERPLSGKVVHTNKLWVPTPLPVSAPPSAPSDTIHKADKEVKPMKNPESIIPS